MEFGAFFTKFYQNNVGGCGATFDDSCSLSDLGFGKRDLETLDKELGIAGIVSGDITVAQLRRQVGARKVGTAETVKRESAPTTREPDINISGCGARTEVIFVTWLRQWFLESHPHLSEQEVKKTVTRDTPITFFNRRELIGAIASRWSSVTSIGPEKEGLTIAGLLGYLASHFKEFREWDFQQGPRGG
jgi:hypothetical protein